jgi:FtsP/CotA-like multicopper oxidase with cupredoxin domain
VVLLGVAAVIAIAAVLLLRTDEEDDSPPAETTARTETAPRAKPKPRPKPPLLTAGSERTLEVEKGKTVAFRVRSRSPEEVHVHGYDILRRAPAGRTVTVRFRARLEGVYEIELERSHTPLATLEVTP